MNVLGPLPRAVGEAARARVGEQPAQPRAQVAEDDPRRVGGRGAAGRRRVELGDEVALLVGVGLEVVELLLRVVGGVALARAVRRAAAARGTLLAFGLRREQVVVGRCEQRARLANLAAAIPDVNLPP